MPSPEQIYRGSTRVLSAAFVVVGIALLVATLSAGGGPASIGFLMGAGFIVIGAGRFWLMSRDRS